jgi:hypothetical protein
MSINPDAHSTRELDLTHWGVEMARKGGVPKDSVLNCVSRDELASYPEKRRPGRRIGLVPVHLRSLRSQTSASGAERAAPRKNRKAALR